MSRRLCAICLATIAFAIPACRPRSRTDPQERPVPGGTLVVSVRDVRALDPAKASWRGAPAVLDQIFDSLTAIDPLTNEVKPAAAAYWRVSKDGLTWTFRLKPGATYHDGRPVRAQDFKLAFDRLARKSTASDIAFQLQRVRGFPAAHDAGSTSSLQGVVAKSDVVVQVGLLQPFEELPYLLAHPRLAPLPVHRYARSTKGLDDRPVGNGPFRVVGTKAGEHVKLARFDGYRGSTPLLDGMEFRIARTVDEGWRAFQDGDVHVAEIPAGVLGDAEKGDDGGVTPLWATLSFGLNLELPKYANVQVRRALSLAIDRVAIARGVYNDSKEAASGIIPRGVRGFGETACDVCSQDRARARRILRAAFGSKIPAIALDHLNEASSRQVARAIANDLTAVGIKASLRAHSRAEYVAFLQAGKHDLAQLGWLADVPTPDGFLGDQLRSGSANNVTGFRDARFDTSIDRARAARDERTRLRHYRGAERRALELMPLIPIVFFRGRTAVADSVRNFAIDGAGVFDGARIWLARQ